MILWQSSVGKSIPQKPLRSQGRFSSDVLRSMGADSPFKLQLDDQRSTAIVGLTWDFSQRSNRDRPSSGIDLTSSSSHTSD